MIEEKNTPDENSTSQDFSNADRENPSNGFGPPLDASESPAEREDRAIEENPAPGPFVIESPEDNHEEGVRHETAIDNTDQMETFHPHHAHHRKRWSDYLFEFFMLFLAVTAGFFVENRREHFIETKRAKQYSKQLLADLRLDSSLFESRNRNIDSRQEGHDSLLYLLTQKPDASDKEVLETLFTVSYVYDLPVTTTTYNQMKASGSLRYIENHELTACLQNYYDVLLPKCNNVIQASLSYYMQYINPYYLQHVRVQDYDSFNDTLINKQPVILNRTRQTDQELANIMGTYRSMLRIQSEAMNEPALAKIKETMKLLKEEYNLN